MVERKANSVRETIPGRETPDESRADGPTGNFIRDIIESDLASGATGGRVVTRFPPEPNGYLHIGHAKAICLDFGLAADYDGTCHLRFDDTNPETEDPEFVEAIKDDVRWLGYDWGKHLYHASDYFDRYYAFAEQLIMDGKAYVDSEIEEEIRKHRGTVTEPGVESPFRNRSPEENLDLFRRMKAGEFADGAHVLRAKGDMASPNMKMRDPLLYRIRHAHHYRTGDTWCIYPMYDYAHPLGDAIEGITHSLCTLEFENNREVYDWVVENTHEPPLPHQYEFSRLNLTYTVTSKRKLLQLVKDGYVDGWDDPRMITIAALRRRGLTPSSIRDFVERAGVSKSDQRVDMSLLEYSIRDDLNMVAPRVMCVADPLPVTITNWREGKTDWIEAPYYPNDVPRDGSRRVPFTRELVIDREDFRLDPPKGYYRLSPGAEVRLRYGYVIRCTEVVKRTDGSVERLLCTFDPDTRGGDTPDGRRIRGTIHWVSATEGKKVEVRMYDRLFSEPDPDSADDGFLAAINPESVVTHRDAVIEPSVFSDAFETRYQFERLGYFWRDPKDSTAERPVFNRIVGLKETWATRATLQSGPSTISGKGISGSTGVGTLQASAAAVSGKGVSGSTGAGALQASAGAVSGKGAVQDKGSRTGRPSAAAPTDAEKLAARVGISADDAAIVLSHPGGLLLLEDTIAAGAEAGEAAKWIINEVPAALPDGFALVDSELTGANLARLIALVAEGHVSGRAAKSVLSEIARSGEAPDDAVERLGLAQVSDASELRSIAESVVDSFPDKTNEYREGKKGLIGFFVGQVMQRTGGAANPKVARSELEEILDSTTKT